MKQRQQEKQFKFKCPLGILLIAIFTICIGSLTFGEGLNYMREEKEGFQYLSQGTLLAGIGVTEIIVGIFTFRGKGWAWKSNVVSQIAGII
jgi:hypothetical protein